MRKLPRTYGEARASNICPRCGEIHSYDDDCCRSDERYYPPAERTVRGIRDVRHDERREQYRDRYEQYRKERHDQRHEHYHEPYDEEYCDQRHEHYREPYCEEYRAPRREHYRKPYGEAYYAPRREERCEPQHEHCREPYYEEYRAPRREEYCEPRCDECCEPQYEHCREPHCEEYHYEHCHEPQHEECCEPHEHCREPRPRHKKAHARRPCASPKAAFEPKSCQRPPECGARLFGDNAMMGVLILMLLGGGTGGISEMRQLFMHPMFKVVELMNSVKGGGSTYDAFGSGGMDMDALGSILAGLRKDNDCE